MFEHLRLADGTVINVLAVPILEYCDLLLTSQSHQAVDLLGRQLQVTIVKYTSFWSLTMISDYWRGGSEEQA